MTGPDLNPRFLRRGDIAPAAESLTRAFAREPFHQWMVPDAKAWASRAPRYFRSYIAMLRRDGCADTLADGAAVALWLSPDAPGGGFFSRLRVPFVLWRLCGLNFQNVMNVIPLIERHRPREAHWYLDALGVDPAQAGQGLGSALLQHGLARADASGKASFVDTLEEGTMQFYARRGFQVTARFDLPIGLPVWCMVRPPGAAGSA